MVSDQRSVRNDLEEGLRRVSAEVRQPATRTALFASLFAMVVLATAIAGRSSATEVARTVDQVPATTTEDDAAPPSEAGASEPPARSSTTTTSTPTTTPTSATIAAVDRRQIGRWRSVDFPRCSAPGFASGRLAVVATVCLPVSPWLAGADRFPLTEQAALVVLPVGVEPTTVAHTDPDRPILNWTTGAAVVGEPDGRSGRPIAGRSGGPVGTGSVVIGWLPCQGDSCDVTADPVLATRLAVGRLIAAGGLDGDGPVGCESRVLDLAIIIDPLATTAGMTCHIDPAPAVPLDTNGCATDVGAGDDSTVAGRYRLRLAEIGPGDGDRFQPLLIIPAAERLCLDPAYDLDTLRVRFRTVLTADGGLGGLLTETDNSVHDPTGDTAVSDPTGDTTVSDPAGDTESTDPPDDPASPADQAAPTGTPPTTRKARR